MSQPQEKESFNESDGYLGRILFKTLFSSSFETFECNKQIVYAEQSARDEPNNQVKHGVLISLYNMCMGNLVNREFYGPIKTSRSVPKFYEKDHNEQTSILHQDDKSKITQSFDLDEKQLDIVTEEIMKTKTEKETKDKINELFAGADPNNLEKSLKERPTIGVGFFLARNHQAITVMGQRIEQLLQLQPKVSLEKWFQLSQFSKNNYPINKADKPVKLEPGVAASMNKLVKQECLPEFQLEQWSAGDAAVNEMAFSTCAASVMCAESIQKCFDRQDGVEFYNCLVTDPDLLKCTTNVIMPNIVMPSGSK